MMTHKDYVKLAGALAEARAETRTNTNTAEWAIEAVEVRIAHILADDNPMFDRHRFHLAAIGQPMTNRDRPTGAERIRAAQGETT